MSKSIILFGKRNEKIVEEVAKDIEVDVFYFELESNMKSFLEMLENYETLVFVASLGSWEGEVVVEIAKRYKPKVAFFCLTRGGDIHEVLLSRTQANKILSEFPEFKGVIISEDMPSKAKIEALKFLLV